MENKPYSYYISPEDIQTRDKLTLYNECLLEILTWEQDGSTVALANEALLHVRLQEIFDSMNTDDQITALQNKKRILRGSHEHNNTVVQVGDSVVE